MTRKERALANAKKMAEESRRKIVNATTGMFANEYKKRDGKWNISKLAKELNMSRPTVMKYIKEIEIESDDITETELQEFFSA